LGAGADLAAVIRALDLLLLEQQAARRSRDFLAGVARVLANVRRREAD
jgi:FtsZ-interacting cell division protein YlmF